MTDKELESIRKKYKIFWGRICGKKYSELGSELGMSSGHIAVVIRLDMPYLRGSKNRRYTYGKSRMIRRKVSDDCLDAFIEEGFTQSEIARSCNCSRQAMSLRFKKKEIKTRLNIELPAWRKRYRTYWARIHGKTWNDISKITGHRGGRILKYCPELKTR